ncbi:membrane protein insertase YidC, partial [Candidatus Peregrinibacteria bacterium]|nr:membrane protein insertase YidC [Candidatus Peregrinibacteria bacterium]MBI4129470.1 membrane protein insertase YidC [Candidatus Peregrinibacteria bacterium]
MPDQRSKSRLLEFLLIFAIVYLVSQTIMRFVMPKQSPPEAGIGSVALKPVDATVRGGHHPIILLRNHQRENLRLPDRCPMPPVDVFFVESPGTADERKKLLVTKETVRTCVPLTVVAAGSDVQIDLAPWKYSLFAEEGTYEVRLPVDLKDAEGKEWTASARFALYAPGPMVKAFRTFVTKPFLNFLILSASLLPDHNLGIAIIVLTLLVKIFLFFPTQHAMEGQRKMQLLQPKLEALKKQCAGDSTRLHQETMKLWKEHKVNPLQSFLPMVIQFPILIGLFYVIQDGVHLEISRHLLYPMYRDLPWAFGTRFLFFDLTRPDWYVFPVLLVALQFLQMKLSFAQARKKAVKEGKESPPSKEQATQQRIMLYALPVMVGVFAFQFPAAVSLYWGVSTLFAIGQQMIVNRERIKP